MLRGIEWTEITALSPNPTAAIKPDIGKINAMLDRIERALAAGGDGHNSQTNWAKYNALITGIRGRLLTDAQEKALIQEWQSYELLAETPGGPAAAQGQLRAANRALADVAHKKLLTDLDLKRQIFQLGEAAYAQQELVVMLNWVDTYKTMAQNKVRETNLVDKATGMSAPLTPITTHAPEERNMGFSIRRGH